MFKINYLIPSNKNRILLGKLVFLEKYQTPSVDFPYFYLNSVNETLSINNWPDLVPYLYDKTLGFFTTISNVYQFKNIFEVYSFYLTSANQIILKLTDINSVIAIKAINEDRKLYYVENGNYTNWNRTVTPKNDFKTSDNNIILTTNTSYQIIDINIQSSSLATVTLSIDNTKLYEDEQIVINKQIEFGLYRLSGSSKTTVFYNYVKSKYFSTPNSNDIVGGLRSRSQIIGHTHEHVHTISHTHTLVHTHDLSNHSHYMNHQHSYADNRSDAAYIGSGAGVSFSGADQVTETLRTTNYTRDYTDGPNTNTSGAASLTLTSVPNNNNLTSISAKTINNDNGLYTDSIKFKYGDKNNYDSISYYAYIYGASYVVT